MTKDVEIGQRRGPLPWRLLYWGGVAVLLSLPLIFRAPWTVSDFIFAGLMFGIVGGLFELTIRSSRNWSYRGGVAVVLVTSFLLIWINGAVGIIGNEDNPANLLFLAIVLAVVVGGFLARFRARGMALVTGAASLATAAIAAYALVAGLGAGEPPGAVQLTMLIGFFAGLWLVAAGLFRNAAGDEAKVIREA